MNREFWARIEERAGIADDRRSDIKPQEPFRQVGHRDEYESPIERLFAEALAEPAEKWGFEILPQYELGHFRFDFAIKSKKSGNVIAVVECDGREFHSSPQQRANDKAKDKFAKAEKLFIFRVTGSDICRHAQREADQIIFRLWPR